MASPEGDMVMSKLASVAALGVAMFPCQCDNHIELVPYVHGISPATMFRILVYFCYSFYQRARQKGHTQAKVRAVVYAVRGILIVLSLHSRPTTFLTECCARRFLDLFFTGYGRSWWRLGSHGLS